MNELKRYFISLYSTSVYIACIHSLIKLFEHGIATAWTGAVVATLPAVLFFSRVFLTDTVRTSRNLPLLWLSAGLGSILVLMLSPAGTLPLIYALGVGLIGSLLYDFWYSHYPQRDASKLVVGKELPDFQLRDVQGKVVSSKQLVETPALFMFYRGNWCPLCVAQIKEVAAAYQELLKRGVKTYLVSNQSSENTAKLAKKFDVPLNFLVDEELAAASALGIVAKGGTPVGLPGYAVDTNLPTVVMTNAGGEIIYADLTDNYRVRPEPATFLAVLDKQ